MLVHRGVNLEMRFKLLYLNTILGVVWLLLHSGADEHAHGGELGNLLQAAEDSMLKQSLKFAYEGARRLLTQLPFNMAVQLDT